MGMNKIRWEIPEENMEGYILMLTESYNPENLTSAWVYLKNGKEYVEIAHLFINPQISEEKLKEEVKRVIEYAKEYKTLPSSFSKD